MESCINMSTRLRLNLNQRQTCLNSHSCDRWQDRLRCYFWCSHTHGSEDKVWTSNLAKMSILLPCVKNKLHDLGALSNQTKRYQTIWSLRFYYLPHFVSLCWSHLLPMTQNIFLQSLDRKGCEQAEQQEMAWHALCNTANHFRFHLQHNFHKTVEHINGFVTKRKLVLRTFSAQFRLQKTLAS
jgi:hypothetical protein